MSYRKRTKPKFCKNDIVKYKGKLYAVVNLHQFSKMDVSIYFLKRSEKEKCLVKEKYIKKATQDESDKYWLERFANA